MSDKAIPEGHPTVTPFLIVDDPQAAMDFLVAALDARPKGKFVSPDGRMFHGELWIGDSPVMLGNSNEQMPALTSMFYLYVPDVDAVFAQAVSAGGKALMEPQDMFYGDRSGCFKDPSGNIWWLATHIEDVSDEELKRRFTEMQSQATG